MTMTKYDRALTEVRSVLREWFPILEWSTTPADQNERAAKAIVDRLVAKGVIQSTDLDDLSEAQYRTGPLEPGRTVVGGDDDHKRRVAEARDWALTEHAETLRRLGADEGGES